MISKVLVANRGEIAIRVMRACHEAGISTVAVYSEADKDSLFVKYADEACQIGPGPARGSYLDIESILKAARKTGAQAIHPGYGFLAENPHFARSCEDSGITFIGPASRVLELVGSKTTARNIATDAGVPVVPGIEDCSDFNLCSRQIESMGYPVIIKPAEGGGGIGMQVVRSKNELKRALETSMAIAASAFGRQNLYIEKYLDRPRHIEVQILADNHGNTVHLGERECSIQRMHNKLVEEAPSPAVTPRIRSEAGQMAIDFARNIDYRGAGTVEFMYCEGRFYFLEMNPRVQVEHTVTEMVTGIDIVKEQLRVASGLPLSMRQEDVTFNGWAIECRINAEDPLNNFAPSPGKLTGYRSPGGIGIRVDSGVYNGAAITHFYHPMISKLLAWGRDRSEAITRMRRALYEYIIAGVKTNVILHKAIMENPDFVSGRLSTEFLALNNGLIEDMLRIEQRDSKATERLKGAFGN